MKKSIWLATAALGLAAAGLAAAHGLDSGSIKATGANFTAATVGNAKTTTCTGSDGGSYTDTKATYTGTATSSDAALNGPITVVARSVINTTTNVGTVDATIRVGTPHGTNAHFQGVYSGGTVVGLAQGHTQDPHTQLLANVSAAFNATTGFTSGAIGVGPAGAAAGGTAVEVTPARCKAVPPPKPQRVIATVTAVSATSITAGGLTCAIPTNLQASVAALALTTQSRVDMTCTPSNGAYTLAKISVPGSHGHSQHQPDKHHRR